jgi:hypothetical protein
MDNRSNSRANTYYLIMPQRCKISRYHTPHPPHPGPLHAQGNPLPLHAQGNTVAPNILRWTESPCRPVLSLVKGQPVWHSFRVAICLQMKGGLRRCLSEGRPGSLSGKETVLVGRCQRGGRGEEPDRPTASPRNSPSEERSVSGARVVRARAGSSSLIPMSRCAPARADRSAESAVLLGWAV